MPEIIKDLIFYEGDRGMGCDRYTLKDELGMLVREEFWEHTVCWQYSLFDTAGNETRTPVPAGTILRIRDLKPKNREICPPMFIERIYNPEDLTSHPSPREYGLAEKKYPFSWEASQ